MTKDRVTERKRTILMRARAERLISASGPENLTEMADRPEFAKHANKHVRAKLAKKLASVSA